MMRTLAHVVSCFTDAFGYDAFGRTASASGPLAATFAHRLSTKPLEAETDLCFFCKTIHLSPCLYDANVFESCVAGLSSMSPSPNYHAPYYDCRTWARHRFTGANWTRCSNFESSCNSALREDSFAIIEISVNQPRTAASSLRLFFADGESDIDNLMDRNVFVFQSANTKEQPAE